MTTSGLDHLPKQHKGFSLVELAVVLIIVTLLSSGLLYSLAAQREITSINETQRLLGEARDALLGFVAANGRLPCPAAPGTTGVEGPLGGGNCSNSWNGFLPAITLGITPTNANGYAIDAWGNPIGYAVTKDSNAYCTGACFTTVDNVKAAWNGGVTTLTPDLQVCSTATGASSGSSAACASGNSLSINAVAVIYSGARNGGISPSSADESANTDGDRLFVFHTPTPAGANEFDDLVIWISPNTIYNRLIVAGRLP